MAKNTLPDIIATSPIVGGDGTIPHRIVIREFENKYVVHTEVHENDRIWYHNGNYFVYSDFTETTKTESLKQAYECFDKRVRRSLHIGE